MKKTIKTTLISICFILLLSSGVNAWTARDWRFDSIRGCTFDIYTTNKIDGVYLGAKILGVVQFNHMMYLIFTRNGTEVWLPDRRITKMYRTGECEDE